jgi:hypothetical protein
MGVKLWTDDHDEDDLRRRTVKFEDRLKEAIRRKGLEPMTYGRQRQSSKNG